MNWFQEFVPIMLHRILNSTFFFPFYKKKVLRWAFIHFPKNGPKITDKKWPSMSFVMSTDLSRNALLSVRLDFGDPRSQCIPYYVKEDATIEKRSLLKCYSSGRRINQTPFPFFGRKRNFLASIFFLVLEQGQIPDSFFLNSYNYCSAHTEGMNGPFMFFQLHGQSEVASIMQI